MPEAKEARFLRMDLFALFAILIVGILCTLFLSPSDPFLFDDNAFFLTRLSLALEKPNLSVHDWFPQLNGGYPDLQFYPPGYVLLGRFIQTITLSSLDSFAIYYLIGLIAFILPGLTAYLLARSLRLHPYPALTGALFVLLIPTGSSGLQSFYFGMHGSRLSLALGLFGLAVAVNRVQRGRIFQGALEVGLTSAASLLCHVYSASLPLLGLVLMLLTNPTRAGRSSRFGALFLSVVSIFLLSAFWLLPGLAHSAHTLSFQWSDDTPLGLLRAFLTQPWNLFLFFFTSIEIFRISSSKDQPETSLLKLLPLSVLGVILLNRIGLVGVLNVRFLDTYRLLDGLIAILCLEAGTGIWSLGKITFTNSRLTQKTFAVGIFLSLFILALLLKAPILNQIYPRTIMNTQHLSTNLEWTGAKELWDHLSRKEGAVLCTSPFVELQDPKTGQGYGHNHLLAMTPLFSSLPILNATPTVSNPLCAYLLNGENQGITVEELVEEAAPARLFGLSWDEWQRTDPKRFLEECRRFGITSIIVQEREEEALRFINLLPLDHEKHGLFHLYRLENPHPHYYQADALEDLRITQISPERLRISIKKAREGAQIILTGAYYPLWRSTQSGVKITESEWRTLILELPVGNEYQFDLVYKTGWVEHVSTLISSGALLVWILLWSGTLLSRRRNI